MKYSFTLSPFTSTLVVLLAMVGYGLNPLFARWTFAEGISPEISLIYRYGLPALLLCPFLINAIKFPKEAIMAFLGGVAMGIGSLGYFKALAILPVSLCILIFFTYPVFTILASVIIFKEPLTKINIFSTVLILIGCSLTLNPTDAFALKQWIAIFWCFLAPLGVTTIILIFSLKIKKLGKMTSTAVLLSGNTIVGAFSIISLAEIQWLPNTSNGYWIIIGLALITALLPHVFFIWASPTAGPVKTAITGSVEFLTSMSIGWVVFMEPVLWNQAFAAILILTALLISVLSQK